MADWNAKQYLKFANERTQPAIDLANRIAVDNPRKIVDIGCGPGNSTAVLLRRFPGAYILGIDNSPNMIAAARKEHPSIAFAFCDASKDLDTLDNDFDIVFSNACMQWLPNHPQLLGSMMARLRKGGVLAVQMPYNAEEPAYRIVGKVAASRAWASKLQHPQTHSVLTQGEYFDLLSELSADFSIWQTTYFHALKSHRDIFEWIRGTALKPYLEALSEGEQVAFEQDLLAGSSRHILCRKMAMSFSGSCGCFLLRVHSRPPGLRPCLRRQQKILIFSGKALAISAGIVYNSLRYGRLAQLVEHSLDVRRVSGSSPLTSTSPNSHKGSGSSYGYFHAFTPLPCRLLPDRSSLGSAPTARVSAAARLLSRPACSRRPPAAPSRPAPEPGDTPRLCR